MHRRLYSTPTCCVRFFITAPMRCCLAGVCVWGGLSLGTTPKTSLSIDWRCVLADLILHFQSVNCSFLTKLPRVEKDDKKTMMQIYRFLVSCL